ncbi:MAG TPA: hypothetical protein VNR66_12650 [Solirubrobacteraceae bacterium]|nr:hypothetical protein [Solirubrobacteraceae bacterium]
MLGGSIGDPRRLGLDAMFPAAFLALLAPQLTGPAARTAAICGALLALALVVGRRALPADLNQVLELIAVPVLAEPILVQTFDGGRRLVIDARAQALCVAALLVWRRAPFLVVVLGAAATAALVRAVT